MYAREKLKKNNKVKDHISSDCTALSAVSRNADTSSHLPT